LLFFFLSSILRHQINLGRDVDEYESLTGTLVCSVLLLIFLFFFSRSFLITLLRLRLPYRMREMLKQIIRDFSSMKLKIGFLKYSNVLFYKKPMHIYISNILENRSYDQRPILLNLTLKKYRDNLFIPSPILFSFFFLFLFLHSIWSAETFDSIYSMCSRPFSSFFLVIFYPSSSIQTLKVACTALHSKG
jgi:hypothetical protein